LPYFIITTTGHGTYEVGTEISPTYTVEFKDGHYKYPNPTTESSAMGLSIEDIQGLKVTLGGSEFTSGNTLRIGETTNVSFGLNAIIPASEVDPVSSLGFAIEYDTAEEDPKYKGDTIINNKDNTTQEN
jgi:hypothetical protein